MHLTELIHELERTRRERDICLEKLACDKMARDLERIQGDHPEVCDLCALGDDFIRLVENGIDALTAYRAVCQKPAAPDIGALGTAGHRAPELYSSRELDRLTARDLEDPAVYKKAIESLKHL